MSFLCVICNRNQGKIRPNTTTFRLLHRTTCFDRSRSSSGSQFLFIQNILRNDQNILRNIIRQYVLKNQICQPEDDLDRSKHVVINGT
jgi:hypothetical protein